MRRPIHLTALAAAVAVCAVTVSGCSASVDSAEAPPAKHVAYLWAVGAEDAAIVQDDGIIYIELSGVEHVITRFSDRPDREASAVDLRDFLGRWEGRFAEVPPNAVLSFQEENGAAPVQIVAELSRPRYNEATSSIVFAAEIVEYVPDALEGAEHPVEVPETVLPAHTGPVSLFIDSEGPDVSMSEIAAVGEATATVSAAIAEFRASAGQSTEGAAPLAPEAAASLDRISVNIHRLSELSGVITEVSDSIVAEAPRLSPDGAAVLVSNGVNVADELDVAATRELLEEIKAAMSERSRDLEAEIAFIQRDADAVEKERAEVLARVAAWAAAQIAAGSRPK